MTETLCTSDAVKLKAGENATILTGTQYTQLINQAEGQFVADTGVNWLDVYSGLNADFKQSIEGAVASKAAVSVIAYNPFALGSTVLATMKINVCLDEYDRTVAKLKDANIFKPFGGTQLVQ